MLAFVELEDVLVVVKNLIFCVLVGAVLLLDEVISHLVDMITEVAMAVNQGVQS